MYVDLWILSSANLPHKNEAAHKQSRTGMSYLSSYPRDFDQRNINQEFSGLASTLSAAIYVMNDNLDGFDDHNRCEVKRSPRLKLPPF